MTELCNLVDIFYMVDEEGGVILYSMISGRLELHWIF